MQLLAKCVGLISFPIVTRLLTVSEYGQLALANTILLFMYGIGKCGIPKSLICKVSESSTKQPWQLYWSGMLATGMVSSLVSIVYIVIVHITEVFFFVPYYFFLLPLIVLSRNLMAVHLAWMRAVEKITTHNILSSCFETGATIVGVVALITIAPTLSAMFTTRVIFEGLVVLSVVVVISKYHILWPDYRTVKKLLSFGIPLVWLEISMIIMTFGDRFQIGYLVGTGSVGLYAAAYNLAQYTTQLLCQPLILAIYPLYNKMYVNEGAENTRIFLGTVINYYFVVALPLFVFISCYSADILGVLASEKYTPAAKIVPIILLANIINGCIPLVSAGLYVCKKTKLVGQVTISAALLNFSLNWMFIYTWGYVGAAVTTLITFLFLFFGIKRKSDQYLSLSINYMRIGKFLLLSVLAVFPTLSISGSSIGLLALKGVLFSGIYLLLLVLLDREIYSIVRRQITHD